MSDEETSVSFPLSLVGELRLLQYTEVVEEEQASLGHDLADPCCDGHLYRFHRSLFILKLCVHHVVQENCFKL